MDRRDIRMIQRGERPGFALEPREALGILRERLRQDLDRDLTAQVRIGGSVHLAHAADADLRGNGVWTQAGTRREAHNRDRFYAIEL